MVEIIGVRFQNGGKVYYFSPDSWKVKQGDLVITETSRGTECGEVAIANKQIPKEQVTVPLKPILRVATREDRRTLEQNRKKEERAFQVCQQKIAYRKLKMNLVDVECTFDNSKLLFYFTADNRVDFRELVKDLAAVFRTRIELRQIDSCPEQGEDPGRYWYLRQRILLQGALAGFPAGFHSHGKGTGAFPESDEDLRLLRQIDVLPEI
mgnify:CR=1 FL=1